MKRLQISITSINRFFYNFTFFKTYIYRIFFTKSVLLWFIWIKVHAMINMLFLVSRLYFIWLWNKSRIPEATEKDQEIIICVIATIIISWTLYCSVDRNVYITFTFPVILLCTIDLEPTNCIIKEEISNSVSWMIMIKI